MTIQLKRLLKLASDASLPRTAAEAIEVDRYLRSLEAPRRQVFGVSTRLATLSHTPLGSMVLHELERQCRVHTDDAVGAAILVCKSNNLRSKLRKELENVAITLISQILDLFHLELSQGELSELAINWLKGVERDWKACATSGGKEILNAEENIEVHVRRVGLKVFDLLLEGRDLPLDL